MFPASLRLSPCPGSRRRTTRRKTSPFRDGPRIEEVLREGSPLGPEGIEAAQPQAARAGVGLEARRGHAKFRGRRQNLAARSLVLLVAQAPLPQAQLKVHGQVCQVSGGFGPPGFVEVQQPQRVTGMINEDLLVVQVPM